jgi:hypothetical protein
MTLRARWIWRAGSGALFASALGCGLIVGFGDLAAPDGGARADASADAGRTIDAADGTRGSHDAAVDRRVRTTDGEAGAGYSDAASWCGHRQPEMFGLPFGAVQNFCDDFDEYRLDGSLQKVWSVAPMGGSVELQTDHVSSPRFAVRTAVPTLDGSLNTTTLPQLSMALGGGLVEARCVLDFNVEQLETPANPEEEIFAFTMSFGARGYYHYNLTWVIQSPMSSSYVEAYTQSKEAAGAESNFVASLSPNGPTQGFLTNIAFSLRRPSDGPNVVFNVAQDGQDAGSLDAGPAPDSIDGFVVGLGFTFAHSYAGGASIDFDNVACDWH